MQFVADESVDAQIVTRLRNDGFNVFYIAEASPSISDAKVLAAANRRKSILITADKDFGDLVYRQHRSHKGIILLRLAGIPPLEKAEITASVIASYGKKLLDVFTVVTTSTVRLRAIQKNQ
jgi:predicted nuclease of predicted toxin-antitoxin system